MTESEEREYSKLKQIKADLKILAGEGCGCNECLAKRTRLQKKLAALGEGPAVEEEFLGRAVCQ